MLNKDALEKIYSHSLQEYPNECCGIVTGDEMGITIVHKCRNIQDELHKKDPERYSRDARTAYHIDPKEMLNIFKDAEKKGLKVIAFYHSHPDHAAYFSQEDVDLAMGGIFPFLIIGIILLNSCLHENGNEVTSFKW